MPADLPPPSLDELLSILSSNPQLSATPRQWGAGEDTMTLNFTFYATKLAAGYTYVFEYPSKIFPEIVRQLELLRELMGLSSMMEDAYRFGDPKKSIDDAIAFMEQELNQDTHALGSLYTKMRREHFEATVKYLRELDRRRREAQARLDAGRRRQAEEDAKRRAEQRHREEEDRRGQEEKRRKWEEEEAKKRRWQQRKTSESGYARGSAEEARWREFREGGGFDHMRGERHFEDLWRAMDEEFRRREQRKWGGGPPPDFGSFWDKGTSSNQESPPPPPDAKRKWYEILGCAAGAKADEIRKAARNAAKGLHPDKNKDPEAIKKFQEISEAKAEGLAGL